MGREARANPRTARNGELKDGPHNPAANRLQQRGLNLDHPIVKRMRRAGHQPSVTLAGTRYVIDVNGTYRRAPVVVDEAKS